MSEISEALRGLDLEDLMDDFEHVSDQSTWPAFVVRENAKSITIRADLGPDFSEDNVFVDMVDNYVCISASQGNKSFQKEWLFPADIAFEKGRVTMNDHRIEVKIPIKTK